MGIKKLRLIARGKFALKRLWLLVIFTLETIMCFACYSFIAALVCIGLYFAVIIFRDNEVIRYYVFGMLTLLAIGLSLAYISKYNKKYRKNDSNSSKRQNDFLFESDIRREEGRYSDRRNLE
jgi:Ca2+/Na+ antiporter